MNSTQLEQLSSKSNYNIKLTNLLIISLGVCLPLSVTITNIILALLILTWILSKSYKESLTDIKDETTISVLSFLVFVIIGVIYTTAPKTDILHTLVKYSRLLYIIPLTVLFKRTKIFSSFIIAFAIGNLISMLPGFGLSSLFSLVNLSLADNKYIVGGFRDSISTSIFISFSIYISLCYSLFKKNSSQLETFSFIAYACIAFYFLMFICVGRIGQINSIILLTIISAIILKKIKLSHTIILSIFILSSCWYVLNNSVFKDRINLAVIEGKNYIESIDKTKSNKEYKLPSTNTSTGIRLKYYLTSLKIFKLSPIFGHGTGSYKTSYSKVAKVNYNKSTRNPHNQYLLILCEQGIIGLIAFFAIILTLIKRLKDNSNKFKKSILLGLIITTLLGCATNSYLIDFSSGHLFIVFLSLLLALANNTKKENKKQS